MPSTGPNYAGTGATDTSVGTRGWSNEGNITSDNSVYSQCAVNADRSCYLKATNFGFAIDAGQTIRGIVVEIQAYTSSVSYPAPQNYLKDWSIKAVKAGTIVGTDQTQNSYVFSSVSEVTIAYGASNNLWGQTWTPAQINANDFGFVFSFLDVGGDTSVYVDFVRVTVYHDTTTTSSTSSSTSTSTSTSTSSSSSTSSSTSSTTTWAPTATSSSTTSSTSTSTSTSSSSSTSTSTSTSSSSSSSTSSTSSTTTNQFVAPQGIKPVLDIFQTTRTVGKTI